MNWPVKTVLLGFIVSLSSTAVTIAGEGGMQRDAVPLSFSVRNTTKKPPLAGRRESDREEVKVNLLVHMDARGTPLCIPIWVKRQLLLWRDGLGLGCAARLISTTALGSATRRDLHRPSGNSGSAAGTPGCRLGRFRNSESVKVKGKQNVLHSCVRHGLNLLWTGGSAQRVSSTRLQRRARQLGISRRPKSTPFSAADANRAQRRRCVGAGEAADGQHADPSAGSDTSVEADAGGGEVPINGRARGSVRRNA
jgi:hypothetical protein